ncbi:MAG TPA: cyclic pyranopterin monophosphate synthase MoaC [Thermoflexales bacterium]|nr:cyclic pyranopterin monophosphate synthase MoaC [Thermoflexales bacterium]
MGALTHLNAAGEARMVDVGAKDDTRRDAEARGRITLSRAAFDALVAGQLKKGDALGAARIAGIMAAKRTSDLIPLCHPITLTRVEVTLTPVPIDDVTGAVEIVSRVECVGKTGVEMEALTAVSVAALTVYDMAKALDRGMRIDGIELLSKSGGKSGDYRRTA